VLTNNEEHSYARQKLLRIIGMEGTKNIHRSYSLPSNIYQIRPSHYGFHFDDNIQLLGPSWRVQKMHTIYIVKRDLIIFTFPNKRHLQIITFNNRSAWTMILTVKKRTILPCLQSVWFPLAMGKRPTRKLQRSSFCNPPSLLLHVCEEIMASPLLMQSLNYLPSHRCALRGVSLVNHTLWLKYTFIKYLEGLKPLKITAMLKELRGWDTKQPDTKVRWEIALKYLQIGDRTMTRPIG